MGTTYFQVGRKHYKAFCEYLKIAGISFEQTTDFTEVGQWCIIKAYGSFDSLKLADMYLDRVLR